MAPWFWETSKEDSSAAVKDNINSTIHFNNIYELHSKHQEKLEEINVYLLTIGGIICLCVLMVIIVIIFKFSKKKYHYNLNARAREIALEMVEKSQANKH